MRKTALILLALGCWMGMCAQKFGDIIESDRARNLVDGFTRREAVEELCKKCGFRQKFGMDSELPEV